MNKKQKQAAWIAGIVGALNTLISGSYAWLLASLSQSVQELEAQGRLNEGDKEGCMLGCAYVPVVLGSYLVGGVALLAVAIGLGFAIRARKPWLAILGLPGLALLTWVFWYYELLPD